MAHISSRVLDSYSFPNTHLRRSILAVNSFVIVFKSRASVLSLCTCKVIRLFILV